MAGEDGIVDEGGVAEFVILAEATEFAPLDAVVLFSVGSLHLFLPAKSINIVGI